MVRKVRIWKATHAKSDLDESALLVKVTSLFPSFPDIFWESCQMFPAMENSTGFPKLPAGFSKLVKTPKIWKRTTITEPKKEFRALWTTGISPFIP